MKRIIINEINSFDVPDLDYVYVSPYALEEGDD